MSLSIFFEKLSSPFFSIIIPVYNTERYVARCLESCVNQTFRNIEIIVIDDCGQDNSMQITWDYAQKDDRIKICQNSRNMGPLYARNVGESLALGNFILYVDSDDFIELDACSAIYQAIHNEYNQSMFYPDICWFGSKRLCSKREKVFHPNLNKSMGYEVFKNNMTQWEIWGRAFSREVIQKANNFLERFALNEIRLFIGEDVLKSFAINLFAQKSIGLNKILYFYCDNPVSITKNHDNFAVAKRNADQLDFVISFLDNFDDIHEAKENPYYFATKEKVKKILSEHKQMWDYQAFIAHRFDSCLFAYPRVYFGSLKIKKDFRRVFIRVFVYLITFGFVKI